MDIPPPYSELPPQFMLVGAIIGALILAGIAVAIIFLIRHRRPGVVTWRERMSFLPRVPLSGPSVLALISAILALYALLMLVSISLPDLPESEWGFVLQGLFFHWLVIIFALLYRRRSRRSWQELFGFSLRSFTYDSSRGMLAYLISLPVILGSGFIYQLILYKFGYQPSEQAVMSFLTGDISAWTRLYGILFAVMIAPVAEELLFRGMLLPLLARRLGVVAAVLASSLLFAVMHFYIPALLPLFVVSLACCFAYIYTGSLTTAIVLHAIFNAVNLTLFTLLHGIG
jgi:membrane protease YdiL (CAAX protease family)